MTVPDAKRRRSWRRLLRRWPAPSLGLKVSRPASSLAHPGTGFEPLEPRLLLTAVAWDGESGDGLWTTAANWSNDQLPTDQDDVTIANAAVVLNAGTQSINSLVLDSALTLQGGATLSVAGAADINAALSVSNATIADGSFDVTDGSLTFNNSGNNRMIDVAIIGDNAGVSGGFVRVTGGLSVNGTFNIGTGQLAFDGSDPAMSGDYTLAGGFLGIYGSGGTQTLTINSGATVRGAGSIGQFLGVSGTVGNVVNQGTILASSAGQALTLNPRTSFTNEGRVQAGDNNNATLVISPVDSGWTSQTGVLAIDGGTLNLAGAFTTAGLNLSAIDRIGGTLNLTGSLDNSNATLTLDSATGTLRLAGGTVSGGMIDATAGAFTISNSFNNRLLDVSIVGDNASVNGGAVRVNGSLNVDGTLNVGNGQLAVEGSGTLETGTYLLSGGVIGIYGTGGTQTLTFDESVTVRGHGELGRYVGVGGSDGNLVNHGTIIASAVGTSNLAINPITSFVNTGRLQAGDNNPAVLTINPSWSSTGVLAVDGGNLRLDGSFSTADLNLANIDRTGGLIEIRGILDNSDSTLALDETTGDFGLISAQILGGTIQTSPQGAIYFGNGTRLDSVTIDGDLTIAATVDFTGTLNVTGTCSINSALSLVGNGMLESGNYILNGTLGFSASHDIQTLTLGPNVTVSGVGSIGSVSGFPNEGHVINHGVITAAEVNGSSGLFIQAYTSFTNLGRIETVGPTAKLTVRNDWTSADGVIAVDQGKLRLEGTFDVNDLNLDALERNGGIIEIGGTFDNANATLPLDATTGNFHLNGGVIDGGTIQTSAGGTLTFANSSSNRLINVTIDGDVNASGGFVRVSGSLDVTGTFAVGSGTLGGEGSATLNGDYTIAGGSIGIYGSSGAQTLTLGPSATILGNGSLGAFVGVSGDQGQFVIDGQVRSTNASQTLSINVPDTLTLNGSLFADANALISVQDPLNLGVDAIVQTAAGSTLTVNGSLVGATIRNQDWDVDGTVSLQGGTVNDPRQLEALGQNLGASVNGYIDNYSLNRLLVNSSAYVQLVNNADNGGDELSETLYLDELTVSSGGTLDLNGLNIYARTTTILGDVINGNVISVNDPPAVTLDADPLTISENGGASVITASLTFTTDVDVTIDLGVSGSATSLEDFTLTNTQIVIPAGNLSASVTLTAVGDAVIEGNETVVIDIDGVANATEGGTQQATVTIVDDVNDLPDLVVSFAEGTPEQLGLGQQASISLLVTNLGDAAAVIPSNTVVQLYLSTDSERGEGSLLLSTVTIPSGTLSPSATHTALASFTVPGDLPAGDYQIIAVVDATDRVAEADEENNAADAPVELALLFGEVPDNKPLTLAVTDDDGTVTTLRLAGGGSGQLIAGDGFFDVLLTNTTSRTSLKITTRNSGETGDDGLFVIRNLIVTGGSAPAGVRTALAAPTDDATDAALAKILAKTTRLIGTLDAPGGLAGIDLAQADGAIINIGAGDNPDQTLTLKFVQLQNVTINSDLAIKSLQTSRWIDTDEETDALNAPWVGAIKSTGNKSINLSGDFEADLTLIGPGPNGQALGATSVAGDVDGAVWTLAGSFKSLKAGNVGDAVIVADGALGAVSAAQWISGGLSGQVLKSLKIAGDFGADLTLTQETTRTLASAKIGGAILGGTWNIAGVTSSVSAASAAAGWAATFGTLSRLTLSGDMQGATLRLTQAVDDANPKALGAGAIAVGGSIVDSDIRAAGHINSITARELRDSLIFLGLDDLADALPDAADDFTDVRATLGSLNISQGGPDASYVNALVAAGRIGSVNLQVVQTDIAHGLAATSVDAFARVVDGQTQKLSNLAAAEQSIIDGQFELRIVA